MCASLTSKSCSCPPDTSPLPPVPRPLLWAAPIPSSGILTSRGFSVDEVHSTETSQDKLELPGPSLRTLGLPQSHKGLLLHFLPGAVWFPRVALWSTLNTTGTGAAVHLSPLRQWLPQCHSFPYHTTACGKSLNCVSMNPFLNSQFCGVICLSIYANTIPYFLFLVTALVYISVFYVIPYHLKQNVRTLQQLCPSSSPSSVLPSSRTSLSRIINPTIHFYSCFKQWIIF